MLVTLCFDILGDYAAKRWATQPSKLGMMLVIGLYMTANVLWAFSLKYEYLSRGTVIINVLNSLAIIMIGVIVFKEDLSAANKIGLGLGVASLYLLNR